MAQQGSAAPGRRPGLSVCIVAYKDLSRNTRVARQAAALAQAGHKVTVVGFGALDLRPAAEEGAATAIAAGVPAYPKSLMTILDVARHMLPLPRGAGLRLVASAAVAAERNRSGVFARRVAALLGGRSFDVIQSHDEKALIAAAAVRRRCGGRLVFDAVEVPFDDEKLPKWPVARAVRLAEMRRELDIARFAEGWVTVNDALADDIADRYRVARPLVLRNCQCDGRWPSDGRLRRDLGLTDQARLLLHLNTLRPGEGVETAIDALAELPPDVHFATLGPEGESGFVARMRRRAAERGVADRFHVPPLQPVHAIPAYAGGADIGVIARQGISRNNRLSLPNRLFQMIGARLPVAATPLPEIARLVREWELGQLFDEGDSTALAAAVRAMMEPAALAGFRRAVDRAASTLTWERESGPYVKMIETLVAPEPDSAVDPSRRPLRGVFRIRIFSPVVNRMPDAWTRRRNVPEQARSRCRPSCPSVRADA
jgi:glycosyltransferase involved in cell wall biosynthesis